MPEPSSVTIKVTAGEAELPAIVPDAIVQEDHEDVPDIDTASARIDDRTPDTKLVRSADKPTCSLSRCLLASEDDDWQHCCIDRCGIGMADRDITGETVVNEWGDCG